MKDDSNRYGAWCAAAMIVGVYVCAGFAQLGMEGRWLAWSDVAGCPEFAGLWAVWIVLAFVCGKGLRKQYLQKLQAVRAAFPDVDEKEAKKAVYGEFAENSAPWYIVAFLVFPVAMAMFNGRFPTTAIDWVMLVGSWTAAAYFGHLYMAAHKAAKPQ